MQALTNDVQFDKCTVLKTKLQPERLVEDTLVRKQRGWFIQRGNKFPFFKGAKKRMLFMSSEDLKINVSIKE